MGISSHDGQGRHVFRAERAVMPFRSLFAGRACALEWTESFTMADVVDLLQAVKRLRAMAAAPIVLLLLSSEQVAVPPIRIRDALAASLAQLLESCERVFIAI